MKILWFIILFFTFISVTAYFYYQFIIKKTIIIKKERNLKIMQSPNNNQWNDRKTNFLVFFDREENKFSTFQSISQSQITPFVPSEKDRTHSLFPFDLLIVNSMPPSVKTNKNPEKNSVLWVLFTFSIAIASGVLAGLFLYHLWKTLCNFTL